MRIKKFQALHPGTDIAEKVASVPYDTVDSNEARALAEGNPHCFLHIVRPEINLTPEVDIHSEEVYETAACKLHQFIEEGVLVRDEQDALYIYRQIMGQHTQWGVVGCCNVWDYKNEIIKKHEKTRHDKENDRFALITKLQAHSGPVFLTYRDDAGIDEIVAAASESKPMFDFVAPDGVQHTVWKMENADDLVERFEGVPVSYIADGHHRAAAATRCGLEQGGGAEWFLAVLFPASQLRIMAYNRCVRDLNGLTNDQFMDAVKARFTVTENAEPIPDGAGRVSMYLGGKWYGVTWAPVTTDDPVASLDVSYLQDNLLAPVLGIEDPRTDKRIDFIGGIRGVKELKALVDSGRCAVAFSVFPVTVEQMMAIADADRIMPPKSTWFEPKLRSGLLVHTF